MMIDSQTLPLKDGRVVTIREAEIGDAEAMLRYVDQMAGETDFLSMGPGEFGVTLEEEKKLISDWGQGAKTFMLIALVDGTLVGNVLLAFGKRPRLAHVAVMGLSVLESHWGLGIGRHLCE